MIHRSTIEIRNDPCDPESNQLSYRTRNVPPMRRLPREAVPKSGRVHGSIPVPVNPQVFPKAISAPGCRHAGIREGRRKPFLRIGNDCDSAFEHHKSILQPLSARRTTGRP